MTDHPSYGRDDRARRVPEAPKRAGAQPGAVDRDDFARDRARVLHSYAFRRLADKTQVVVPGEDDFPRTRLTHSLEVAQIGREIAARAGLRPRRRRRRRARPRHRPPAVRAQRRGGARSASRPAAAASRATRRPCGCSPGSRRRWWTPSGEPAGLNLTRAVLDATCKYPWPRRVGPGEVRLLRRRRRGVRLAAAGPRRRAALPRGPGDGLGRRRRLLRARRRGRHPRRPDQARHRSPTPTAPWSARSPPPTTARCRPTGWPRCWTACSTCRPLRDLADGDGSYRAQAAAKRATSELTGRFSVAAVEATRQRYGPEPLTRYAAELVVPETVHAECALLKALAVHLVMRRPGTAERQAGQRRLLTELTAAIADGAPGTLGRALVGAWHVAAERRRPAAGRRRPGGAADRLLRPRVAQQARPAGDLREVLGHR